MHAFSEEHMRRHWRLVWLSSIQAFCDTGTQRERWLDPAERNPHFSLVECMCCYLDDAHMGEPDAYLKALANGHVSEAELAAVTEFHVLAEAYQSPTGDDWDSAAVLADPAWHKVTTAAQHAQQRLLGLLDDPTEIRALTRPLAWRKDGDMYRDDLTGSTIVG